MADDGQLDLRLLVFQLLPSFLRPFPSALCRLSSVISPFCPLSSVICHLTFSPSHLLTFCPPSSVVCHLSLLSSVVYLLPSVICHLTFLPSHLLPFPLCPLPSVISPFCLPSSVFCPLSSVLRPPPSALYPFPQSKTTKNWQYPIWVCADSHEKC
jgi:hypothetical protein